MRVSGSYPTQCPPAKREEVDLLMFIYSDNASNKKTRRSRTGFMIKMNMSQINCYSKKQSTIETSIFVAEFFAMKFGVKTLHAIQYKLWMMGIRISGALHIYGDNISDIHKTLKPESILKKKHNVIAYDVTCKSMAIGESLTGHRRSENSPANLLTQVVTRQKYSILCLSIV